MKSDPVVVRAVGFVKPPLDYGPAIDALSDEAHDKMITYLAQGIPQDQAIARAADWDNEQLRSRTQ